MAGVASAFLTLPWDDGVSQPGASHVAAWMAGGGTSVLSPVNPESLFCLLSTETSSQYVPWEYGPSFVLVSPWLRLLWLLTTQPPWILLADFPNT